MTWRGLLSFHRDKILVGGMGRIWMQTVRKTPKPLERTEPGKERPLGEGVC